MFPLLDAVRSISMRILRLVVARLQGVPDSRPPRRDIVQENPFRSPEPDVYVTEAPAPVAVATLPVRETAGKKSAAKKISTVTKTAEKKTPAPAKPAAVAKTKGSTVLAPLSAELSYQNTVWIPRILWAMEWSVRTKRGPATASELSKILNTHTTVKVQPNNVARAFRDLNGTAAVKGLWKISGKKYVISPAGSKLISGLLKN